MIPQLRASQWRHNGIIIFKSEVRHLPRLGQALRRGHASDHRSPLAEGQRQSGKRRAGGRAIGTGMPA